MQSPTPEFEKDPEGEAFLEHLNAILEPHERDSYRKISDSTPTLHVIGVPRSGTTLLGQLVARHLDVGYINNLIAAFWRAPVFGLRLSNKLLDSVRPPTLESTLGRTESLAGPHEFGYFWKHWLKSDDLTFGKTASEEINWTDLARVFANIAAAARRPVVFKSFLLAAYLEEMLEAAPRTCFLWVRRDLVDSARSLVDARVTMYGSRDSWMSIKPPQYDQLITKHYWQQVAGQVYHLDRLIDAQVRRVQHNNVLEIHYEDLCLHPVDTLDHVRTLLRHNGATVNWIDSELSPIPVQEQPKDEVTKKIERALEDLKMKSSPAS